MQPNARKSLDKIPDSLQYYPHQIEGIRMMARMGSFLLCDEMGLGKSIQALTVAAIDFQRGWASRVLVVCPASLKWNWEEEIHQHTKFRALVLDGTPAERGLQLMSYEFLGYDILIINYEQIKTHLDELRKLKFDIAIYDECHVLKNPNSVKTKAALDLHVPRRFMLTGSPMLNRVNELWVPLHMISPEQYPDYWRFVNRYCTFGGYKNKEITGVKNRSELQHHLDVMMIRRLKRDVLDLPEKQYINVVVELTPEQRKIYDQLKEEGTVNVNGTEEEVENGLAKFTKLKQIAGSTYTFTGEDHSAKMDRAVDMAQEIIDGGEHLIVFTEFRDIQMLFCKRLAELQRPIKTYQINGDVVKDERLSVVNAWANDKPSVIVCTLKAAGVGLNMTKARKIFFLDRLFVPKLNEQAEDRAHRIGQSTTQPVQIYIFQARKTVEQRIGRIIASKVNLFDSVVEESDMKRALLQALEEADAADEPG